MIAYDLRAVATELWRETHYGTANADRSISKISTIGVFFFFGFSTSKKNRPAIAVLVGGTEFSFRIEKSSAKSFFIMKCDSDSAFWRT